MLKNYLLKIPALLVCYGCYLLAQPEALDSIERESLAAQFSFSKFNLPVPNGEPKEIRNVHPQYKGIPAWISSVGAAVTMDDLNGDGFNDDIIYVDPRYDQVLISSIKGIKERRLPTILKVNKLPFDANTMAPMGTLTYDFNGDGQNDILVYYWGRTPVLFLKDHESYRETELTDNGERWFTNAATLADFDGDGHIDILIANYFPDGSRVLDKNATDQNQVMQHSMSRANNGGKNHFFLYVGKKGTNPVYQEDVNWSESIKNPNDWTLGVAAADFTGDQYPEIYFANDFGPDKFLLNQSRPGKLKFSALYGKKKLTTTSSTVLGKDSYKGMGAGIGDLNNDGLLDLYVSNIADEYALEESHFAFINTGNIADFKKGVAPFVNKSEELGLSRSSWGWESKLADFNNDGVLEAFQATGFMKGNTDRWPELQELALGNDDLLRKSSVWPKFELGDQLSGNTHNYMFTKSKSGKYFDISSDIGLGDAQISRGIAIGDVDNDGDLDFVVANQWQDSYFYENKRKGVDDFLLLKVRQSLSGSLGAVQLNPKAPIATRPAIGAVVSLYVDHKLVQKSFVDGGNGHSGVNSKDVFFGLPASAKEIWAEIHFTDKKGKRSSVKTQLDNGVNTIILPNQ
jgi:hypothetical protein